MGLNCHFSWEAAKNLLLDNHPFLSDRSWLVKACSDDLEVLWQETQESECPFSSFALMYELWEKPIPCLRFSASDGVLVYGVQLALEKHLDFPSNTFYKVEQMGKAIEEASLLRKKHPDAWVLKADIRSFFNNIQHSIVLGSLKSKLPADVFSILSAYLTALNRVQQHEMPQNFKVGAGFPIGIGLNYALASHYLHALDECVLKNAAVLDFVRYVDDIVVFVRKKDAAEQLRQDMAHQMLPLGIGFNVRKTAIIPPDAPFEFMKEVFPPSNYPR